MLKTTSYGGDNLTYNYGQNDGRVKIYNKKRESELNIPGNLTRVEVTREIEEFPITNTRRLLFDEKFFPKIYLGQYVYGKY